MWVYVCAYLYIIMTMLILRGLCVQGSVHACMACANDSVRMHNHV